MPDREKVEEWARDFKAYVDELDIARDDYRGIMEYIDEWAELLKEQEAYIKEPDCCVCGQSSCRHYHETRKPEECGSYVRYEPKEGEVG